MLDNFPWRVIRRAVGPIRRQYYTVPWPDDVPSVLLGADATTLERKLRRYEGLEAADLSYNYRGEVVNLRRPWGVSDEYGPSELHVRARYRDFGLETVAHVEPSRYEATDAHLARDHVDWQAGYEALLGIVDDEIVEEREDR